MLFSGDSESFLKNRNRGIKFRYLTNQPNNCTSLPYVFKKLIKKGKFEIHCYTRSPIAEFGIIDDNQLALTSWDATRHVEIFWTSDPRIIGVFREYYESLWSTSCELQFQKQ